PNGEDYRGLSTRRDDDVFGLRWAVEEVPCREGPLASFDNQCATTRENEERFLALLAVIHAQSLAALQDADVDPEVREPLLPLERAVRAECSFIFPARLTC